LHAELTICESLLGDRKDTAVVGGAEGFKLAAGVNGHDRGFPHLFTEGHQFLKQRHVDAGHVACENQIPGGRSGSQGGDEAAERTDSGSRIREHGYAPVAMFATNESHIAGGGFDLTRDPEGEGLASKGESGFVAPHSCAVSAGQDKARPCHEPMIATKAGGAQRRAASYTRGNISLMKCLVLILGLTGLATAGERLTSTVKADARTGRLVRTVTLVRPVAPQQGKTGKNVNGLHSVIEEAARRHDVDPLLVRSIVEVESAYNPYAISPKGAQGLMQLIPSTARRYGVGDAFDVRQNVEGGVKYFRYLKDLFGEDHLAIAAYNAGENAVLKYGKVPPYPETEQYVRKVGRRYEDAKARAPRQAASAEGTAARESRLRSLEVVTGDDGRIYLRTK